MFQRIYIEITNTCNLNCSFCMKNNRSPKQMTRIEFNHVLDEIKGYTEHVYLHVQGEPFMHPDLELFLDDCYLKEFKVHLVTNGTLLYKMNQNFFKHPALVQLSVSLHANQMMINDNNFIVLKELISTIEHQRLSLFLRIWTYKDESLMNLINALIDPINSKFTGKRIRIKKNLFIDLDDEFEWPNLNLPFQSKTGICHAGSKMMAILSDGTITPCCLDANGIINIGNIFSNSFGYSLNSDRYTNFMNGYKKRQCVETLCQNCSYRLRFNKKAE